MSLFFTDAQMEIVKESHDFWRGKDAPTWLVWSLCGNEQRETSFNWRAVGDHGKACGIGQWWPARSAEIKAATGIDVRDPHSTHSDQLKAMFWEISESREYGHVWPKLMATKDEYEACYILVHDYERAAKTERDVGIQVGFAQSLAKTFGGGASA